MTAVPWWKTGVLYQIYPRSFADSNSDGVGDLRGIIDHLDYLAWLGVDGIWVSPITVSPNVDWGYDVADYCAVQPDYGTLSDFDALVSEAEQRGIRVLLDLVPNHTSDQHPWFVDSRSLRRSRHRDWYVWADPKPYGSPPNNWVSLSGSSWTLDESTGQAYLHNFTREQPDLNWWNEEVKDAFDEIQRFWFDRGVAGFRIDVCHMIVKDAELRDNPPSTAEDDFVSQLLGQRAVHNANRPEVHDILRRWRQLSDSYVPPRVLIGETVVHDLRQLARFYGNGEDELHLAFNIPFIYAGFDATSLPAVVETTEKLLPTASWPVWAGSNHDVSRMASRWSQADPRKIRAALVILLTLRGTPVLYQGDEIGILDTTLEKEDLRDPVGLLLWPHHPGRDPARTPMPWEDRPGGGFASPGVKPWLPLGDLAACNVKSQQEEPHSILNLTRDLISLRRQTPDLQVGDNARITAPEGVWAFKRGQSTTIALNLSDTQKSLSLLDGCVSIGTDRHRDRTQVSDRLDLDPWEGVVVAH